MKNNWIIYIVCVCVCVRVRACAKFYSIHISMLQTSLKKKKNIVFVI